MRLSITAWQTLQPVLLYRRRLFLSGRVDREKDSFSTKVGMPFRLTGCSAPQQRLLSDTTGDSRGGGGGHTNVNRDCAAMLTNDVDKSVQLFCQDNSYWIPLAGLTAIVGLSNRWVHIPMPVDTQPNRVLGNDFSLSGIDCTVVKHSNLTTASPRFVWGASWNTDSFR